MSQSITAAYATLLTRPSYLAGTVLLSHTLHKHSPSTPLIILYTPETLPEPAVKALEAEAKRSKAILWPVDHLRVPEDDGKTSNGGGMVAERFIDTWTKLRVFEVLELPDGKKIERLCFLDADMMIFSNPTPLIFNDENDAYLRGNEGNRVCATHVCVCNLDGDAWAPADWTKENCPYAPLKSSTGVAPSSPTSNFNSGTFVFHPSPSLRSFVMDAFHTSPPSTLHAMKFPDQDFLNVVFTDAWKSLTWRVNALKTWRYWHTNLWTRDSDVAVLHYIVDKPWAKRVKIENGEMVAGYKGDDGDTHSWWWDEFGRWKRERREEYVLLDQVSKYVAAEDGEGESEEMKAIGGGAQDFAKKWADREGEDKNEEEGKEKEKSEDAGEPKNDTEQEDFGQGPHGPILRKKMLGERGHGRVVRGGGGAGLGRGHKINPNGSSYMEP
jgi:inositol 3-alpha-galactosyltransferase